MKAPDEIRRSLRNHTGSEAFTRYSPALFPKVILTEGAKDLAESAECYWLMDVISSHQLEARVRAEGFQVWNLRRDDKKGWHIWCEDGNDTTVADQTIGLSDFPLPEGITLWACHNELGGITIMLPSEY